jgi:hypothetical protein
VARDRADLVRRRPRLCQLGSRRLSNTVGRTVRQISLSAPILKLVAETVGGERLPELSDQESEVAQEAASMLTCNAGCSGMSISTGLQCSFFA